MRSLEIVRSKIARRWVLRYLVLRLPQLHLWCVAAEKSYQTRWIAGRPRAGEGLDWILSNPSKSWDNSASKSQQLRRVAGSQGKFRAQTSSSPYDREQLAQAVEGLELVVQRGSYVNPSVFHGILKRCILLKDLGLGTRVHALAVENRYESNAFVANQIICMYSSHGRLQEASQVFGQVRTPCCHMWASIILANARHGQPRQAIELYRQMRVSAVTADTHIFVAVLKACAAAEDLSSGREVHAHILDTSKVNMFIGTGLVDMYSKCGSLEEACRVFDNMTTKDVVTWNAMMAGYVKQGLGQECLSLYGRMQREGITSADAVTYLSLLQACGSAAGLEKGKEIHALISETGLEATHLLVASTLIDMYGKCGSMVDAQQVFNRLSRRDIVTWSALLAGYARQGESGLVFDLFQRMREEGIRPDGITFLTLLKVCSHVGLVDKGLKYFEVMRRDCGITPAIEHYTSIIDLLGRAGQVDKAMDVAQTMPFRPDAEVWRTVLGACWKWKNVKLGRRAFEYAVRVDQNDPSTYVLMSNIYAAAHMLEESKNIQAMRMKSQAWKKPGQSWWTDVGGVVHKFVAGDKEHPESQNIYGRLQGLLVRMKKEGYVPHLESVLRDIPDDEKEAALCGHSEKLAIGYALLKTSLGTTIRVVKNLRVCEDCHSAIALISKIEQRTIICRDASRFHVFKDGKCSCGDYW